MLRDPELRIAGCSRTDSGVHALDQHVSFTAAVAQDMTADYLKFKLNRWLPDDILVLNAVETEPGFNARFSNFGKAYTYCISPGKRVNPLATRYVWMTPHELDVEAMRAVSLRVEAAMRDELEGHLSASDPLVYGKNSSIWNLSSSPGYAYSTCAVFSGLPIT